MDNKMSEKTRNTKLGKAGQVCVPVILSDLLVLARARIISERG